MEFIPSHFRSLRGRIGTPARRDHELREDEREEEKEHGRVLSAIIKRYESVLGLALDNRWVIVVVILANAVGAAIYALDKRRARAGGAHA